MKHLIPSLEAVIRTFSDADISPGRKSKLRSLAGSIYGMQQKGEVPALVFICTHNSRRSQMAQCWAAAAAVHYGLEIDTYSGGTEVTAFHPNAADTLQRSGFTVVRTGQAEEVNPIYEIGCSDEVKPIRTFSKLYSDPVNPESGFIAVMTCSEADEGCPFIPGADQRISLPFEDPKRYDGTAEAPQRYDETCRMIGCEIFYLIKNVHEIEKHK